MIPLRDTIPCKNRPVVNYGLIAANVLVFLAQTGRGADLPVFYYRYGLVPARFTVPDIRALFTVGEQLFSLVSFMFLHGGVLHLLGNVWTLYIFGDNVEDHLGPLRYLVFYLLCGMASGLFHLMLNLNANVPVIGASGAIAGVMGAYFVLYPGARILTFVPIFFIPYFFELPAFVFLGFWIVLQFVNAAFSPGAASGIAWWAHIGGFLFGIGFLKAAAAVPVGRLDRLIRVKTARKTSDRLQIIRPVGPMADGNLYGTILITPQEALTGAKKMVNIPRGVRRRLFRVIVPPGIAQGALLRLKGFERDPRTGEKCSLMLKVQLQIY